MHGPARPVGAAARSTACAANATWTDNTSALGIDTTNGNFTYGGSITQALTLTKLGANTLTLTGANTYTRRHADQRRHPQYQRRYGAGAANAPLAFTGNGTLQAGADGIVLNSNRNITVNSGVTATIDTQAFNMSIAGPIGGQGGLTKVGTGTLTLTGSNNYTGNIFLTSGTLAINNRQQGVPSSSVVMSGNTTLDLSGGQRTGIGVSGLAGRCVRIADRPPGAAGRQHAGDRAGQLQHDILRHDFGQRRPGQERQRHVYAGRASTPTPAAPRSAAGELSLASSGALPPTGAISFTGGSLQATAANTTDYSSRFSHVRPGRTTASIPTARR